MRIIEPQQQAAAPIERAYPQQPVQAAPIQQAYAPQPSPTVVVVQAPAPTIIQQAGSGWSAASGLLTGILRRWSWPTPSGGLWLSCLRRLMPIRRLHIGGITGVTRLGF